MPNLHPLLGVVALGLIVAQGEAPAWAQNPKVASPTPSQAPQDKRRTVVFLGDSLTAGYGLSRAEAFPARVEKKMRESGFASWKVVNAGVSGDTSAGGLARLDWVFRAKPDVLFVCLGANDGLRGLPLDQTERNLRSILERGRKEGATLVLGGMLLPSNYGPEYTEKFAGIFPKVAKDFQARLVPFVLDKVALSAQYTLPDGIHPNAEGTRVIADTVWKTLEPVIRQVSHGG